MSTDNPHSATSQPTGPYTEDDLTNALIEHTREREQASREDGVPIKSAFHDVEVPYSHYGNRGSIDLYERGIGGVHVFEFKSDAALNSVTGANAVIRQFNRARAHFFPGSAYTPRPTTPVSFELCFIPSERTARHVMENQEMYATLPGTDPSGFDVKTIVTFRHPEHPGKPLLLFTENWGVQHAPFEDYSAYACRTNPVAFEAAEPVLQSLWAGETA
ncbi:hypothetical protein [Haladaptatus sp. CMSO5]|uniref:hypothetical protein n=1 Tax=Haladaptatus sp. CMSO5 TaxID=3120514 RepID=UPI002FCE51D5